MTNLNLMFIIVDTENYTVQNNEFQTYPKNKCDRRYHVGMTINQLHNFKFHISLSKKITNALCKDDAEIFCILF